MQRMMEAPPKLRREQVTPAAWKHSWLLNTCEYKFNRLNFLRLIEPLHII
jgi:hypothetical protein